MGMWVWLQMLRSVVDTDKPMKQTLTQHSAGNSNRPAGHMEASPEQKHLNQAD